MIGIGKIEGDQCDFCKRYFACLNYCIAGGEEEWFLCDTCFHKYKDVDDLVAVAPVVGRQI